MYFEKSRADHSHFPRLRSKDKDIHPDQIQERRNYGSNKAVRSQVSFYRGLNPILIFSNPLPDAQLKLTVLGFAEYDRDKIVHYFDILDERPVPSYADLYSLVNTASILRVEVLKHPVDLAFYGFRGANGVIKVTTDPS